MQTREAWGHGRKMRNTCAIKEYKINVIFKTELKKIKHKISTLDKICLEGDLRKVNHCFRKWPSLYAFTEMHTLQEVHLAFYRFRYEYLSHNCSHYLLKYYIKTKGNSRLRNIAVVALSPPPILHSQRVVHFRLMKFNMEGERRKERRETLQQSSELDLGTQQQ